MVLGTLENFVMQLDLQILLNRHQWRPPKPWPVMIDGVDRRTYYDQRHDAAECERPIRAGCKQSTRGGKVRGGG